MFKIQKHKTLIKDFHKIVSNRLVLFNDGDNDLIFTGTNIYSNRLLCCIMFEDDEEGFLRYLHVLTSEEQYSDFLNKKITLRQIIEENQSLFLIDVNYSMNEIDSNIVSIDEIPKEFLPLENSYCPDFISEPTFSYSLSMIGGLADLHKATAEELSNVSTHFSDFLKSSTTFLHDFKLGNHIYVEALQAGSFKINFSIEISEPQQTEMVNVSMDNINSFLNNYFKYVFNRLPLEEANLFEKAEVISEDFKQLEKQLGHIYSEKFVLPKAGVEQKLIDLINYSTKELENIEYHGSFDSLKFENISDSGEQIPCGIINSEFIDSIKTKLFSSETGSEVNAVLYDQTPKNYTFQVYNFNTISGKGSAWYVDSEGSISKIIVHAKGRDSYENTIFTKSMDDGKKVELQGIGKTLNGKLKLVTAEI